MEMNRLAVAEEEVRAPDKFLECCNRFLFFDVVDVRHSVFPNGQMRVPDDDAVFTGHQTFDIYDVCCESVCLGIMRPGPGAESSEQAARESDSQEGAVFHHQLVRILAGLS